MNLSYYKKWVSENPNHSLALKTIETFEDIVILSFKENTYLIICDNILFFTQQYPINTSFATSNFNSNANNAILNNISLLNNDKIIQLHFIKKSIYNEVQNFYFIIELIPRYQNLILCIEKEEKKIILDCKKKITLSENQTRQILPGSEYLPPNTDFVHNDINIDINVNEYFQNYFTDVIVKKRIESLKKSLLNQINKEFIKLQVKLEKQKEELISANKAEHWLHCVELLKSNLYAVKMGMDCIKVIDYFKESYENVSIKLDPKISPKKNLENYVKKYRKAVNGIEKIKNYMRNTELEIEILETEKQAIIEEDDYFLLKQKDKHKNKEKIDVKKKLFRKITIDDDWEINIGRSSKENDLLTCKTAHPEDWWFHSRVFHGTHVVLRNRKKKQPPNNLVILCCELAAYYSKAKNGSNVPVDYTQVKFVHKPKGSPPGFVVYKNEKTLFVNPALYP